jgi:hypothetical protein
VDESPYARIPFPKDLPAGPYDERDGANEQGCLARSLAGESLSDLGTVERGGLGRHENE